ncbi:MAG TPA: GNAT family N-acetyltransferase [Bacillota bacterium]|nr:GNAT family N-acetyltransferase [Bacillota bacterium]
MKDYRFEDMKPEYLEKVLEIYNYYILNSTATFHIQPLTVNEMTEIVFHDNPRYRTLVIFDGDDICGYGLLAPYRKREAYDGTAEITIYLKQEATGRGLGSLTIKHLEEIARGERIHTLIAVICGENQASIKLFEKNGYTQCANLREVGRKFGRLLDVVCHQKIL